MLVITPNNITDLPGNSGIVIVLDHQPAPLNPSIEADFETSSIYCDQPYNSIEQIIKDYNIDVEHVYMKHYLHWTDFPYPHTCIPWIADLGTQCTDFLEKSVTTEYSDKQNCFIMGGKRRENRLLVSAWFNQNKHLDFDYTQGWEIEDDDFVQVEEYTRLTSYSFDGFLNKRFVTFNNNEAQFSYTGLRTGYQNEKNVSIWNNVFKEKFCSSTFAIITEPVFWEKACSITEKYVMSLYGCCFPIFCGGYRLAEQLTRIGFDVFDDIIDHSYQYELHPGLRVLNALELNRKLLESQNIRKLDYMDRHLKNLSLVRENLDSFTCQFNNIQNFKLPDNIRKF
jgi:hypothetical protein